MINEINVPEDETIVGNNIPQAPTPEFADSEDNQSTKIDNSIFTCISNCYRKSFLLSGRASRSEFWYFVLFMILVSVAAFIVGAIVSSTASTEDNSDMLAGIAVVGIWLFQLCSLPAFISVTVRRLHDINRSGWNFWWEVVPFGGLYLLYLLVQPSEDDDNDYDVTNNSKGSYKGFFIFLIVAIIAAIVGLWYFGESSNQERFCEAERVLEGKVLGPKDTSATDSVYLPADTLSALPIIKELAEDEYGPAMWYMAEFTAYGLAGIQKDSIAAIEMYKKAATQLSKEAQDGDMYAQCCLSLMYSYGDGVSKDDRLAFNWMTKAAEQGYDDAQNNLANLYFCGEGVDESDTKAFEWWAKAAAQKNPNAMLALGKAYMNGTGTTVNKQAALKYFTELANCEYIPAYYQLANYYHTESDYAKAKTYFEKASNNSDCCGDFSLGMLYINGYGVKADVDSAISYLERAHEGCLNSSSLETVVIGIYSQLLLANCYYEKKKYAKAFNLYKELADVEEPAELIKDAVAEAQYMVAVCYSWGNGCKQSFQKEELWRKKALANGYKE